MQSGEPVEIIDWLGGSLHTLPVMPPPTCATLPSMKLEEALARLEALGDERMRAHNVKHGAGDNQFGVRRGDVRKLAKEIKNDHELALALWATENIDARFLAILWMQPTRLSSSEMDRIPLWQGSCRLE